MRKRTMWCKAVLKALIDRDMSVAELAKEVGIVREYCSAIVHGRTSAPDMAKKIAKYLDINTPYDVVKTYPM